MDKLYDETQVPYTKASGFRGGKCWACHLAHKNVTKQKLRATPVGRATANLASRKARSTAEGKAKASAACLVWCRANPGQANAISAKRRAAKLQRTPAWADFKAIEQVYLEAQHQGLVVDHIYPLQGTLVSGLHVANNLQLLRPTENSSKKNKMPNVPETWGYDASKALKDFA